MFRACTQKLLHETNQLSIVPNLTAYAEVSISFELQQFVR